MDYLLTKLWRGKGDICVGIFIQIVGNSRRWTTCKPMCKQGLHYYGNVTFNARTFREHHFISSCRNK